MRKSVERVLSTVRAVNPRDYTRTKLLYNWIVYVLYYYIQHYYKERYKLEPVISACIRIFYFFRVWSILISLTSNCRNTELTFVTSWIGSLLRRFSFCAFNYLNRHLYRILIRRVALDSEFLLTFSQGLLQHLINRYIFRFHSNGKNGW